ncbi:MAG: ubiquitin-binding protein cue5 [Thelocarpon impressellum]|nr:MAG: ubiquitin-binding protein cue5 [Thelocarpon impressellum]
MTPKSDPESPTTARELDFDDDIHDSGAPSTTPSALPEANAAVATPTPGSGVDVAPPKPPRPMNPQQEAEATLREAFPAIDAAVVKAVLMASGGRVEPAFNALLDDLPIIKENIRKGFLETQTKVNRWVQDLKKKIDGEEEDEYSNRPAAPAQQSSTGRPSGDFARRSADRVRYDADPRVLADDLGGLELRDDGAPPRRSSRPLANPDLFKPTPAAPSSDTRRVSFQAGPPEDIDALSKSSSPKPAIRQASPAGKASKWEPLSTVEPNPVADNDPFSLGDSDEEREAKAKDLKSEDSERLKRAAAEAMAEDIGGGGKKEGLEAHAHSGTKDKDAEDNLAAVGTGKS